METNATYVVAVLLMVSSCQTQQEQNQPDYFSPKVLQAKGYTVPQDSMIAPVKIPAGEPQVIEVGNPKVVKSHSNVYVAGSPKIVAAGTPKVAIPGSNGLSLPQTVPAIFSSGVPAIPNVSPAKEAYSKDQNPHNFSTFSKLQGLKSNLILSLLEDNQGNIWFGTNYGGVSKYDGKNFSHFSTNEGLSHYSVRAIIEDENGSIWFGTSGGGLNKYDGKTFSHLTKNGGLSQNGVWSLLKDKNQNLWIGTIGGGVGKFDGEALTHYSKNEGLNDTIISILEDRRGNLWFGTFSEGVSRFDGKRFTRFTEEEGLINNRIWDMHEDKSGHIWFATSKGACKYDGSNFIHFTKKEGLSHDFLKWVWEDRKGSLWFGTNGGGINRFDGKYFTQFTENEGLSINYMYGILEDKNGNLWFGTEGGGVSKYSGEFTQYTDKDGLINKFVSSILEDRNGNLWIGTFSGGVSKFDGQNFVHFTEMDGLTDIRVLCILEDKDGNMWFGTHGGVSKFDGSVFLSYTENEGLSHNSVWSMLEDTEGNLWFGTGGGGVNKFDGQFFTHYTEKQGLSNNHVKSILEDQNGNLWFGTDGGGLNKFDGLNFTHFTNKEGLGDNVIRELIEDQDGNLWVGSHGWGLIKLTFTSNSDSVTYTRLSEIEGLSNNNVVAMSKSKMGDLWIGTTFGFNKLEAEKISSLNNGNNTVSNLFKTYTYEDGFSGIGLNHGKTIFEASDGTIWLGADERLVAFHPQKEVLDKTNPNIQLTGLALFNENVAWQKLEESENSPSTNDDSLLAVRTGDTEQYFSVKDTSFLLGNGIRVHDLRFDGLSRWYGVPENLSLPYDNNHLTFQFVGINTHAPQKIKYQYQLEGIDPYWSGVTERGEASYGNLPHGQYTFKVKAMNGEGIWSSALSYTFTIRPPWWLTWWAYILYVCMGICAIYGARKYTVNRERMKHALKIQKLETEKMQEVDQLKSRFFANISHEFRTPLTLILGPLERFVSRTPEQHPDKPVFQMMQRNAGRLLHLINQLLDLSKIETGSMKLETKPANLIDFLKAVIFSFSSLAERRQIKYHFQYPYGNPIAYFDADKLEKILFNLLSNAFKFTPENGEITVFAGLGPLEIKSIPTSINKSDEVSSTRLADVRFFIRENLQPIYQVMEAADGEEGLRLAVETIPDLILSDVMMPKMDGVELCQKLKTDEKTCHVPVILLTAKASGGDKIEGLETGADDYLIKPFDATELLARIKNLIDIRKKLNPNSATFYPV